VCGKNVTHVECGIETQTNRRAFGGMRFQAIEPLFGK
jgi:hypothetical protein